MGKVDGRMILPEAEEMSSCNRPGGELLSNAVEHGNLDIPEKRVRAVIQDLGNGRFWITVQGEGMVRPSATGPDDPKRSASGP
jgi:anti-sigma regulatory factor (Ser/Thr protein kinase)